jgi:hypothetical protein
VDFRTHTWLSKSFLGKVKTPLTGRDTVDLVVSDYELDGRGSIPDRHRIPPLTSASRPALGPAQPPVQWVPGVKGGRGVMLTTHPLLVPRLRNSRSYTSSHPTAPLWSVTGPLYLITLWMTVVRPLIAEYLLLLEFSIFSLHQLHIAACNEFFSNGNTYK